MPDKPPGQGRARGCPRGAGEVDDHGRAGVGAQMEEPQKRTADDAATLKQMQAALDAARALGSSIVC